VATVIAIAVFAARDPFDAMHQKRVYVLRTENVSLVCKDGLVS
jgi:hypothetical protein